MKKTQKFLAGIFLLAVLLLGLMPVSTKAAALKGTDPCYKITPQLTSASWKYIDEIYRQKYPAYISRYRSECSQALSLLGKAA